MFKIKPERVQRQFSSSLYFFQPSIFNFTLQVSVQKMLILKRNNKGKIELNTGVLTSQLSTLLQNYIF